MTIERLEDLKPDPRNANRGTPRGHSIIETSVRQRGAGRSGLAASDGTMIAGSQTLQKMAELGIPVRAVHTTGEEWVVVVRDDIEPGSEDAVLLAIEDNRATETGLSWEPDVLKGIAESGVDLSSLFTDLEWADVSMPSLPEAGAGGDDFDATPEDGPTRTALGELWSIGGVHRLLVGDCTDAANVARLMQGERADAVVSDPPYGVDFDTNYKRFVGGAHENRHNFEPIANDDEPFDPSPWLDHDTVILWGANCYSDRLPLGSFLVWDKRQDGQTKLLSDGEIAWLNRGHGTYIFNHTWNGFMRESERGETLHPTQKPIALFEWCLGWVSKGAIVLDPYAGSGPLLPAAHRTNRRAYLCEIAPRYADVILRRAEAEGLVCERVDD